MENNNSKKQNEPIKVPISVYRRLNWGTAVVIAFAIFITFILYFVFSVQSNSKYDNELVVEEYYKHDAKFGEEMAKVQNAHDLTQKPKIEITSVGIRIVFPAIFDTERIKGNVSFYRPSNKKFDFEVPILLSNSSLNVPKEKLLGGRWNINMEWQYEGKQYLIKEVIYIK